MIDEGPQNVVLDLSGIDFVDSSGVGALVQIAKQIQNYEGSLQVVSNPRVTQTVKLVRLERFLVLRSSLEEALANVPSNSGASSDSDSSTPPDSK